MRLTFKVIVLGLLTITVSSMLSFKHGQQSATNAIRESLNSQAENFFVAIDRLKSIPFDAAHNKMLRQQFKKVRLSYKQLEWAAEYFDPVTTRLINGPPVPETELSGQVIQPSGLQVIEQLIFTGFDGSSKKNYQLLLTELVINSAEYEDAFRHAQLKDWQIIDAVKQEVFRVETLGLNDFDDPLTHNCFAESAAALKSSQEVILHYDGNSNGHLNYQFQTTINYLSKPISFNRFDRATFLTSYANPLTKRLTDLQSQSHLPDIRYNRLLNQNAATLFETNAFNRNAYTDAPKDSATLLKIALGKRLFFDPLLSGTITRSCSSCHQPGKAFSDGLIKNLDITGKKVIARNTPSLINAALQPLQFYDLRASSLEDQVTDVVNNRDEMHGDIKLSTKKIFQNSTYRKLFNEAFSKANGTTIDTSEVLNALASYIRSLTALNSRFDSYMRGNKAALAQTEIHGFNIFMGKGRCSTCHYLPLFNGTLPPRYKQMDAEVIGVPQTKNGKVIDPDEGLFVFQPMAFNKHAFKVTTIRNAARTAPYMHNGVFKTLEEVVDFYNRGGGTGSGLNVPNQTLASDHLNLTINEKRDLIQFIKSLNSH